MTVYCSEFQTRRGTVSGGFLRFRRLVLALGLVWCLLGGRGLAAQETADIDSLFSGDTSTTVVSDGQKLDLSAITTSAKPLVSGSISLKGGVSLGWSELPDFTDLSLHFQKTFGYSMVLSGTFDARPDPDFHVYGSASVSFPAGVETKKNTNPLGEMYNLVGGAVSDAITAISWSAISLGEVYVDYRLWDTLSFRIGKATTTWGQGRLLGNPGNLLAGAEDGASFRVSLPVLGGSWNALALARPSYFGNSAEIVASNIGLASNWEGSIGPVNLGLAGFTQKAQGTIVSAYLKSSWGGFDIYSETVGDCTALLAQTASYPTITEVAGFYWEGGEPKFQIQGEYLFNGANTSWTDHSLAIGVALTQIPGTSIKLGLQWIHTFLDNSGNLVLGMQTPLAPHLSLSVGVPFLYGAQGSRYVPLTTTQRLGLAASIELSGAY